MEKIEISRVLLPMHTYLQSHLGHPIGCSCVSIGDTVGHKSTAGFWLRARFICNSQDILTDPRISLKFHEARLKVYLDYFHISLCSKFAYFTL